MNCSNCGAELNGSICPVCGFDRNTCRNNTTLQQSSYSIHPASSLINDIDPNEQKIISSKQIKSENVAQSDTNDEIPDQMQESDSVQKTGSSKYAFLHKKSTAYFIYAMAALVCFLTACIFAFNHVINASLPLKSTTLSSTASETTSVISSVAEKKMSFNDVVSGIYTGTVNADGLPHGNGKMTYSNGDIYDGEWLDGQKYGQGTYTWSSGSEFFGTWANGDRNGFGIMKWINGNRYEGNWAGGSRSGFGIMTWTGGDQYEGEWKDDKRTGHGVYTWPSGAVYDGEWLDGKSSGQGTYTWPNGDFFTGEWFDGKRNGDGSMTYSDGSVKIGRWKDDQYVDQ